MSRWVPLLAALALILPGAATQAQSFQDNISRAQKTVDQMDAVLARLEKGGGGGRASAVVTTQPTQPPRTAGGTGATRPGGGGPRVVTLVLKGSI